MKKIVLMWVLIILTFSFGCIGQEETRQPAKVAPVQEVSLTVDAQIKNTVSKILSKYSAVNITEISINISEDLSVVNITYDSGLVYGLGLERSAELLYSVMIFQRLFENYSEVKRVEIHAYTGILVGGEEHRFLGTKIIMSRETAEKIDWQSLFYEEITNIADEYWENPIFP